MGRKSKPRRSRQEPQGEGIPFIKRREVRYGFGITAAFTLLTAIIFLSNRTLWLAPEKIVTVYRVHGCRCALHWERELEREGFSVIMNEVHSLKFIRQRLRTPASARGCHVGEYLGYFLEDHIPAAGLHYLSETRPAATGLMVPGTTPHLIDQAGADSIRQIIVLRADGTESLISLDELVSSPSSR